jgi:hypothetical protein
MARVMPALCRAAGRLSIFGGGDDWKRPVAAIETFSDAGQMKSVLATIFAFTLFGCAEQVDEAYATYADAERAGAVERGWVPAFVPSSAHNLNETHDLDTSAQTLRFNIPPSDVARMVAGLRLVSAKEDDAAATLSEKHGLGLASEVYVVCSEPRNGALAVDRESGRAVFDTTIDWLDNACR